MRRVSCTLLCSAWSGRGGAICSCSSLIQWSLPLVLYCKSILVSSCCLGNNLCNSSAALVRLLPGYYSSLLVCSSCYFFILLFQRAKKNDSNLKNFEHSDSSSLLATPSEAGPARGEECVVVWTARVPVLTHDQRPPMRTVQFLRGRYCRRACVASSWRSDSSCLVVLVVIMSDPLLLH